MRCDSLLGEGLSVCSLNEGGRDLSGSLKMRDWGTGDSEHNGVLGENAVGGLSESFK